MCQNDKIQCHLVGEDIFSVNHVVGLLNEARHLAPEEPSSVARATKQINPS